MRKILVLSDSHGNFNKLLSIYELEKPDEVIYVGDGINDIEELSYIYKNKFYIVRGNCDFFERKYDYSKNFEIDGVKFFITHGHIQYVKQDKSLLKEIVDNLKVDIIIFGHTHKEHLEKYKNSYLFNAGAAEDGKYGIITISENKKIEFFHKKFL